MVVIKEIYYKHGDSYKSNEKDEIFSGRIDNYDELELFEKKYWLVPCGKSPNNEGECLINPENRSFLKISGSYITDVIREGKLFDKRLAKVKIKDLLSAKTKEIYIDENFNLIELNVKDEKENKYKITKILEEKKIFGMRFYEVEIIGLNESNSKKVLIDENYEIVVLQTRLGEIEWIDDEVITIYDDIMVKRVKIKGFGLAYVYIDEFKLLDIDNLCITGILPLEVEKVYNDGDYYTTYNDDYFIVKLENNNVLLLNEYGYKVETNRPADETLEFLYDIFKEEKKIYASKLNITLKNRLRYSTTYGLYKIYSSKSDLPSNSFYSDNIISSGYTFVISAPIENAKLIKVGGDIVRDIINCDGYNVGGEKYTKVEDNQFVKFLESYDELNIDDD